MTRLQERSSRAISRRSTTWENKPNVPSHEDTFFVKLYDWNKSFLKRDRVKEKNSTFPKKRRSDKRNGGVSFLGQVALQKYDSPLAHWIRNHPWLRRRRHNLIESKLWKTHAYQLCRRARDWLISARDGAHSWNDEVQNMISFQIGVCARTPSRWNVIIIVWA